MEPTLYEHPTGAILINYGGVWVRFACLAAYDAAQENLDRQRAAIGYEQTFGAAS